MKVLIWTKNTSLVNIGGPMGYCYNIKSYLDEFPCEEIDFYPGSICKESVERNISSSKSLKMLVSGIFSKNKYLSFFRELYRQYFKRTPLSELDRKLLLDYDYVHVHWASEIFQTFSCFKNGRTKVILTTHTPEPLIDELAGRFGVQSLLKKLPVIRNYFLKREVKAYQNCDFVMFPVADAKEPYISKSKYHKKVFEQISPKTFYVPTAINRLNSAPENRRCLDRFNIPENALKICYVGRHNEVKGYDFLQKIAQQTWQKVPNAYFIIGGKEEPLKGLKDPRWVELGWVKTTELLNEVDVFILPNKETYFDIILLEVLRQGTPVLITKTGGNKWFEDKGVSGIHCFDYGDEACGSNILVNVHNAKKDGSLDEQKSENKTFFQDYLYMPRYIDRYVASLKRLTCNQD